MKKVVLLFLLLVLQVIFSLPSFAENYYTTNHDVIIDVQSNRDVYVTEYLNVYYEKPSYGITKEIPIIVSNGDTSSYTVEVSNIDVNEKFLVEQTPSSVNIKIGNPYKRSIGFHKYIIKYTYSLGPDKLKNKDEFYFNLTASGLKTLINNLDFYVLLPKKNNDLIDSTEISIGRAGKIGFEREYLNFKIEDDYKIYCKLKRAVATDEDISVKVMLPNGYFENPSSTDRKLPVFIIMIVLTLIAFVIWLLWGKDDKVVPIVNFYPPDDKNSAEVGTEFDGVASHKEIASMVMYLANKGYIEIKDDGVDYTLHKLKDYDGKNRAEGRLLNAIFGEYTDVTVESLKYSEDFYFESLSIINALNRAKNSLFSKNSNSIEKMTILGVCILGLIFSIIYVLGGYSFDIICSPYAFVFLFPIVGIIVVLTFVHRIIFGFASRGEKLYITLFITIWGSMFIGIPTFFFILPMCTGFKDNLSIILFGLLCIIISVICLYNMPKRNRKGRRVLGQILGFKQFIEVVEKRRIEILLQENPNYISDILPYIYVLGINDAIIPFFESLLPNSQLKWYRGNLTANSFSKFGSAVIDSAKPSRHNGGKKFFNFGRKNHRKR